MEWLYLSLIAPLFLAMNSVVDQFLSRRYFPDNNFLVLFMGGITYLVILPIIYFISPIALNVELDQALLLIGLGVFTMLMWVPYFLALADHEASMIMPILQLSPVFVFLIAYYLWGEVVSDYDFYGSVLMIVSSILIVFDFNARRVHLKPFILMLISTLFVAIQILFFRYFLQELDWIIIVFWIGVGFCLCGLSATFLIKKYREQAIKTLFKTKGLVLAFTSFQECAYLFSFSITIIALETAPASGLVQTIAGILPLYVLMLSIIGSRYLPDQFKAFHSKQDFIWRLACIIGMFVGLYLIYL